MLSFFSKVLLFILIFLGFGLFVPHDTEAKSRVKLSKRYIPQGNPGGANFYEDEDFAESYRLYEKRRELLKKKKLQGRANASGLDKESLAKKLRERSVALLKNKPSGIENCVVEDVEDVMLNKHGINITRLKGAMFIDQAQYEEGEQLKDEQREEEKATIAREKKISPINVTIKNTSSRKTCSLDSIAGLNNVMQHSLNGSDSFGSVADAAKIG